MNIDPYISDDFVSTDEFCPSHLIQRLEPPTEAGTSPYAFGGGLSRGGFSDEAMEILGQVWTYDYMGAAEFEFGANPAAISKLWEWGQAGELASWTLPILVSQINISSPWARENLPKPERGEKAVVYVIGRECWYDDINARIKALARGDFGKTAVRTKEYVGIAEVLRPTPRSQEYERETCGWLDLGAAFLAFAGPEGCKMWARAEDLFVGGEEIIPND